MRPGLIDVKHSAQEEGRGLGFQAPWMQSSYQTQVPERDSQRSAQPQLAVPVRRLGRLFVLAPFEGWLVLILLAIALYCVVFSIIDAKWVPNNFLLLWCPAIGLFVGVVIAKIPRFPQSILHIAACLIGYWLAIWLTSVYAFHMPWMKLLSDLRITFTGQPPAGYTPPDSQVIFFFYLSFLSFFLGYFGSWLIYRAHLPWLVALVYSSIMLVNINYITTGDFSYLVIIMVAALILLIARMYIVEQIVRWTREGLHTDKAWMRAITWRCMQVACIISVVTVVASWYLPVPPQPVQGAVVWERMGRVWNDVVSGNLTWQSLNGLTGAQSGTNFFGDQLTITGSVHLPMGEVMMYQSSDGLSHYLEGFTYNHFDGHTWNESAQLTHAYGATTDLQDQLLDRHLVKTAITMIQPPDGTKHYIFAPAQPNDFTMPTIVYSDGARDTAWTKAEALKRGEQYQVLSSLSPTDAGAYGDVPLPLNDRGFWQGAGNDYPHLSDLYLQTPKDLSPQVVQLAQQWTQGAGDAYDALKMIESHLNDGKTFHYSVDNPTIPANIDVVDWLLKSHTGYCTHYATAMAMMGRLLHIPMRLVNGFNGGHFDQLRNHWSVDGSDAHSWVQAYLPGHDWINFDPTPGFSAQPQTAAAAAAAATPVVTKAVVPPSPTVSPAKAVPTKQPDKHVNAPDTGADRHNRPDQTKGADNNGWLLGLALGVLLFSLCFFCFAFFKRRWQKRYGGSSMAVAMFWRISSMASWVGLAPKSWQTPYEYSGILSQHLPQSEPQIRYVTEMFVRDRWGGAQQSFVDQEKQIEQFGPGLHGLFLQLFWRKVKR